MLPGLSPSLLLPGTGVAGGGGGGGSPFSIAHLQNATGTGTKTSYDLGTLSIGAVPGAGETRRIWISVSVFVIGTVTSVTLGGNPLTQHITAIDDEARTWIGSIEVASGTSANVTVNLSAIGAGCLVTMWRSINWGGAIHDTASDTAGSPLALTIDVPASGFVMAAFCCENGASGGVTWTNATERGEVDASIRDWMSNGEYAAGASAETGRAISVASSGAGDSSAVAISIGG